MEVNQVGLSILEMISQGLGLEKDHLGSMFKTKFLSVNSCPPCPNPNLTLAVPKYVDHNLITVLYQGNVEGLQILTDDGKWLAVDAPPNTFAVIIGTQLQKSVIEPVKIFVNEDNPVRFSTRSFKDFVDGTKAYGPFTKTLQTPGEKLMDV
ncbi:protein DOWNY MILDEW RESISTANCE 6-like [Andrographis paniculata]|uniref:protein DOWNY MILDEW RESISTANCE 6-like n=1 Tax=Andrographis paniculata TaxID=175694 RepID=UPI0021E8E987|nr:protein DOWNY MILDEW RESISTANCE 6-like [Andrographis paniculata]